MSGIEFLGFLQPMAGAVAGPLSDKIQSKLNPNELEKALNVAIKSSSQLGEKLFSELFSRCEPDSIRGFLDKFFKDVVVEEFQKPFNNQGTPQIDYLVEAFKSLAQKYPRIRKIDEKYLKDWMENFVNTFLSETNIYLKFQIAKDNYLNKLADRLSKHHFVGMGVAVNENSASERLENIFVMPDVAEEVSRSKLNQKLELDSDLLPDNSKRQVDLIKAQQEKVLLLREQLGNLANPSDDVVQQLLPLLKDSNSAVRLRAAEALGKLANTSDNVVVTVEKWLEEEQDSEYKQYGVRALWYSVVGEL